MTNPLIIGIPSKGRLQENAFAFFARAGLTIHRPGGARDYRGTISGLNNIEVAFLSASEIVQELARGGIHLGITGADLVEEALLVPAARVEMLTPLGFGHADVVLAVPEAWIDVHDMDDLEEIAALFRTRQGRRLRVATKYITLTRRFFKAHGIADYRIVESAGATEGAPAAGTADVIVDITSTGATLRANALKVLEDGTILKSEANLIASLAASWSEDVLETTRLVLARIQAEEEARKKRELKAFFPAPPTKDVRLALAGEGVEVLQDGSFGPMILLVAKADAPRLADDLIAHGASRVLVSSADYAFAADSPLYDRLVMRLAAGQELVVQAAE
jgi:ATP phosphoribosyltransferase